MKIQVLEYDFTVCKVTDLTEVDFSDEFCFIGKTDEELSLVCRTEHAPSGTTEREDGWRAFRISGSLDFSQVGILAAISAVLAAEGIPIFALSTYRTDYILTKKEDFPGALAALRRAGYQIESRGGF